MGFLNFLRFICTGLLVCAVFANIPSQTVAAQTLTPPASTNLLTNSGFETGSLSGWINGGGITITSTASYMGNFGAAMNLTGRIEQTFSTVVGRTYYVSARLRINQQVRAPAWGGLRVQVVNSSWAQLASSPFYSTANSPVGQWTLIQFSFVANTTTSRLLYQNFSGNTGQFLASADDFVVTDNLATLTPIPTNTATPLPTNTNTATPSATPTPAPTSTATSTPTQTINPPTATPSTSPTLAPTLTATITQASSPTGFQNQLWIIGLTQPTGLAFTPDGRMLITERQGTIRLVPANSTQVEATPFLTLTNINTDAGERGLVGLALDPNFAVNGYYYIFYTANSPLRDRVSRFTANGNGTVTGSEVVIWQDNVEADLWHHGGAIAFGPDGKLYIAIGDHFDQTAGTGHVSQRLDSHHGKILRSNPDGTIPTDNPFYDGAGPNFDAIWVRGLRNPFRFSFDPLTGTMYIGDVGGNTPSAWEEVNKGLAGANYGWPICEGSCGIAGMTNPIYSYNHNSRDASITGGFVYRGSAFPPEYYGSYFFADYAQNWIRRLIFDANGDVASVAYFEPTDGTLDRPYGDIVDLETGPDGALYYVDIAFDVFSNQTGSGAVRRIRHALNNQPPTITIATANPIAGPGPTLAVDFMGVATDLENDPLSYIWDFGDNTSAVGANVTHTYLTKGHYTARLTVSDTFQSTLSQPIQITVGIPPTVTITAPSNNAIFRAGDVISFTGIATDTDGTLTHSNYDWTIIFHHDTHSHPAASYSGPVGEFIIPASGHDFSGITWYEFILVVTDADGLQTSQSVSIYPQKVNVTLDTNPSALTINFDQSSYTAPTIRDTLIGFQHILSAPLTQTLGSATYQFVSWSDGGAAQHLISVPEANQTYTAYYELIAPATPTPTATEAPTFTPSATPTPTAVTFTYFPVGLGSTDVIPRQIVRTADDRLYLFSNQQYSLFIRAYWATTPGLPTASTVFSTTSASDSGLPISVDAVYDGTRYIHVLVNLNNGQLKDYLFDTATNTFLAPLLLAIGNPTISGDYVGTSGLSGLFDVNGVLHLAYWSASNHITYQGLVYDANTHALTPTAAAYQVDATGNANHPALAISPIDGSITVAWVSQTTTPTRILARTRSAAGEWGNVEIVSTAPVWTSTNFGLNIDQGPSLLIDALGTRHLTYIQAYDATGDYGRVGYATHAGNGWAETTLPIYTHNPALALNTAGELYVLGHGHPQNATVQSGLTTCLTMEEMCVLRIGNGAWANSRQIAPRPGLESFDASPSVKWSVVGFNRPETIEFVFFSTPYNTPTLYYARFNNGGSAPTATPLPANTATLEPTNTHTPEPSATFTPLPTSTETIEPSATLTPLPTNTATPEPSATFTPIPTNTETIEPSATLTSLPTNTATPEPSATFTPLPTHTPTSAPTSTPTSLPSPTPTPLPTSTATPLPTFTFTPLPTATQTLPPTSTFTPLPTHTHTATLAPTFTFTPPPTPTLSAGPVTLTLTISAGTNDVNQDSSTNLLATGSTIFLGTSSSTSFSYTGLRFVNVTVPRNATLTNARLQFASSGNQWITIGLTMQAENVANCATFTSASRPSLRVLTPQSVAHSSNANWTANTYYFFENIATVLQPIVNRSDWVSGNALCVILKGTGSQWARKFAHSFEGNPALAPRLIITYQGP